MSTSNFDGKTRSNTCTKLREKKRFLLSHLQYIININTRNIFYKAHIKSHMDYASIVWHGCSEVHFKKWNSAWKVGKINPSRSFPIYRARNECSWNFKPSATTHLPLRNINCMHKVLNNNPPNYLAQLFISHQSHYTNSRNNLGQGFTCLKLTYPSLERPSGTPFFKL